VSHRIEIMELVIEGVGKQYQGDHWG